MRPEILEVGMRGCPASFSGALYFNFTAFQKWAWDTYWRRIDQKGWMFKWTHPELFHGMSCDKVGRDVRWRLTVWIAGYISTQVGSVPWNIFCLLCLFFWDRVSHCSVEWLWTVSGSPGWPQLVAVLPDRLKCRNYGHAPPYLALLSTLKIWLFIWQVRIGKNIFRWNTKWKFKRLVVLCCPPHLP